MNRLPLLHHAALAGLLLTSELATAQPSKTTESATSDATTQTRELFRKGLAAYNDGQIEEARKLFLQAWAIRPSADVAMELAQSEMALGKYADAAEHLDYALHNFTPSINEKMRNVARQAYADVVKHVGKLNIAVNQDDAEVIVNGRVVGKSPLNGPVYADIGQCSVEAKAAGASASQTVYVNAEKEFPVRLVLQVAPKVEPATAPPPVEQQVVQNPPKVFERPPTESRSIVPVIVGGAVFAVGIAGVVGFKLAEISNDNKADELGRVVGTNGCGRGSLYPNECSVIADAAKTHDRDTKYQVAGLVLAGTAAAVTSLYWFWPRSTSQSHVGLLSLNAGAALVPQTGFAYVTGKF